MSLLSITPGRFKGACVEIMWTEDVRAYLLLKLTNVTESRDGGPVQIYFQNRYRTHATYEKYGFFDFCLKLVKNAKVGYAVSVLKIYL